MARLTLQTLNAKYAPLGFEIGKPIGTRFSKQYCIRLDGEVLQYGYQTLQNVDSAIRDGSYIGGAFVKFYECSDINVASDLDNLIDVVSDLDDAIDQMNAAFNELMNNRTPEPAFTGADIQTAFASVSLIIAALEELTTNPGNLEAIDDLSNHAATLATTVRTSRCARYVGVASANSRISRISNILRLMTHETDPTVMTEMLTDLQSLVATL